MFFNDLFGLFTPFVDVNLTAWDHFKVKLKAAYNARVDEACTENKAKCTHRNKKLSAVYSLFWPSTLSIEKLLLLWLVHLRLVDFFYLSCVFQLHFPSINTLCRCNFNNMKWFQSRIENSLGSQDARSNRWIWLTLLHSCCHLTHIMWWFIWEFTITYSVCAGPHALRCAWQIVQLTSKLQLYTMNQKKYDFAMLRRFSWSSSSFCVIRVERMSSYDVPSYFTICFNKFNTCLTVGQLLRCTVEYCAREAYTDVKIRRDGEAPVKKFIATCM